MKEACERDLMRLRVKRRFRDFEREALGKLPSACTDDRNAQTLFELSREAEAIVRRLAATFRLGQPDEALIQRCNLVLSIGEALNMAVKAIEMHHQNESSLQKVGPMFSNINLISSMHGASYGWAMTVLARSSSAEVKAILQSGRQTDSAAAACQKLLTAAKAAYATAFAIQSSAFAVIIATQANVAGLTPSPPSSR